MPRVYMFPNPRFGKPTHGGGPPNQSAKLADDKVAHIPGVSAVLGAHAKTVAARASARLMGVKAMSDRSEGAAGSRIALESGVIDKYIILDDTNSARAAWKIEKDHGVLVSSMMKSRSSLVRPAKYSRYASFFDRNPPKGLVINVGPT